MASVLDQIVALCIEADVQHAPFLRRSVAGMSEECRAKTEAFVDLRNDKGVPPSELVRRYCAFVATIRQETIFFFRHKRYRYRAFAEVDREIYQNEEFMESYMDGLALSLFLWPNHRVLFDFFARTLPRAAVGDYLEIGPGHGYFLGEAIAGTSYNRFVAADVSPHAIAKARDAVAFLEPNFAKKVVFRVGDIMDEHTVQGKFDAIVMGEVLEHVEAPLALLQRVSSLARPGAYIYISTCTCAPALDHIYLFRTVAEVEDMVREGGLAIVEKVAVGYEGKDLAYCERNGLTINLALQLSPLV